jgi:endoglucanase
MHIIPFISMLLIYIAAVSAGEPTPVEKHGKLSVKGNKIVDQHGNPVQLRGMSLFWSQWMGDFYNESAVKWLVDDWKVTIIRAALGVKHEDTKSGYLYDGSEKKKITTVVDAAIKKGIYVIIDWHDHYAHKNQKESVKFFKEMASRYGEYPNVIYEIFNEPVKESWTDVVKPYSEAVVSAIRSIDPDNLIILGTPYWCQNVDEAANDPLEGENLAYSLHFYAASHKGELRDKAEAALDKGVALFVTEFGTCVATGNGFLDTAETEEWFDFMDKHHLSWCNWSIANKDETSAALLPGTRPIGYWQASNLTASGKIIRRKLRQYAGIIDVEEVKEKRKSWLRIKPIN